MQRIINLVKKIFWREVPLHDDGDGNYTFRRVVDGEPVRELRCTGKNCRQLLLLEHVINGLVQVKCPKCNKMTTIAFRSSRPELIKRISPFKKHEIVNILGKLPPETVGEIFQELKGGE